ncbi:PAS domain-containing sensor histidine kinase [Phenylobacterium sp.]|uniref:hybrid sensor histidine kinase/response regulator n=1 Tax=Phenylobacterium sp. TaxID=1871053 RepID=UPI001200A0FD|nr:PAS domain-containing sensor histidine kinase [Phenylobacterium sp.]THD61021.1 MAG: PAS domain-containing sensor histidine kinase [Phenylobacterium sp.]
MIPPAPQDDAPAAASVRRNTARLAEEARQMHELFDQAPGCMIVFTGPDHVIEMANPAHLAFTGLSRDIIGKPAREAMRRGYSRGFGKLLDQVYRDGRSLVIRNTRLLVTRVPGGPDEEAFADFVLQPMKDASGATYGIFCQGHEVTVEKLAADELRASREQLRIALQAAQAIFDNSHDVICVVGADGLFRQVNKHAERLWGYRPEEMIGRCYLDFVHPEDRETGSALGKRLMAGEAVKPFTNRHLHKDGTAIPVMWSAVRSKTGDAVISIGRDMREHLAAEEKLRQAQKMEAIGRLTGGIAHDFNNLLAVVIGSAESLADSLEDRPELRSVACLALDAAERGAELVSRLLAFARSQPLAAQALDCGAFLANLSPILERTLGAGIAVELEVAEPGLFCRADRTQLTAALLNLCINARDAMPAGGRLTIGAARQAAAEPGGAEMAVLSVRDTGEGMTPQVHARALEPFFTTKPEGLGSGLGLSMAHGFATQSGGRLEIDSEPGRGTEARLCLPLTAAPTAAAEPALSAGIPPQRRARHVLLVEDDDLLCEQVRRQLTGLGLRVTAHRDGRDALRRLRAGADIDLLMTDVVMPGGLNGRQLAEEARRLNPALRILFTSGHTDEPATGALPLDARAAFLPKPYRRAELARKLAEAFGDQPVAAIGG